MTESYEDAIQRLLDQVDRLNRRLAWLKREREHLKQRADTDSAKVRDLQAALAQAERSIQDLQNELAAKDQALADKETERQDLMRRLEALEQENTELTSCLREIESGMGWRLLQLYRRLLLRLFPAESQRGRPYRMLIGGLKAVKDGGWDRLARTVRAKAWRPSVDMRLLYGLTEPQPVDVVMPVYNAYDRLVPAVEAVLKHTESDRHRVILVEDASTDGRVPAYLKTIAAAYPSRVEVRFNRRNRGFAPTVNRGLRLSDRDVVILNTDTIVTSGWLAKLQKAAYSKPRVASVTPFSNNATICSIPRFLEDNDVPEAFTVESFAQFLERISLRYYPEIPTGVGFCMYLKRAALQDVGLFDEKRFNPGYGEENDWCMRAMSAGYIHVLDDATYVYHHGSASFTADVTGVTLPEHLEVLNRLHPDYLPMVHDFIDRNPLQRLHDYIELRLTTWGT